MKKNSPPIFCTATETVEDLENSALSCNTHALLHKIYDMAEAILREKPPTLQPVLTGLTRYLYLMRANAKPVAYVDVFINDLLGLSQGRTHWRRQVRRTFFYSLNKVLWTCDSGDLANH